MLRRAAIEDLNFIYSHVLREVNSGHFDSHLLNGVTRFFFKRLLRRVLVKQQNRKGEPSYFYMFEVEGVPAGFSSLVYHADGPCELWLVIVVDQCRGRGLGKQLVIETIALSHASLLFARCQPASIKMIQLLKTLGFQLDWECPELKLLVRYSP